VYRCHYSVKDSVNVYVRIYFVWYLKTGRTYILSDPLGLKKVTKIEVLSGLFSYKSQDERQSTQKYKFFIFYIHISLDNSGEN